MELTVGILEDKLRHFKKGTLIHVGCGCCHHSAMGNETIISIEDRTNQTYGYIELNINDTSKSEVELSKDRETFYKAEIEKLNKTIKEQKAKLEEYKEFVESFKKRSEWVLK